MADTATILPAQLHHRNYTLIHAPTQLHRLGMAPRFEQRWRQAHSQILGLADQCHRLAVNGLTVYQGGSNPGEFQIHQNVNMANLESLMATAPLPEQLTLAPILQTVLDRYFAEKATGQQPKNGEIIIILIDHEPTDRLAIAKQIVAASQKLDHNDELGIGWLQVGDDYITKGFLATLDDNLRQKGAKFDIVDHKPIQQISASEPTRFLMDVLKD
ncbi:hypothetical protein [Leptothoe sp. PORK10 BA2]|uniref:hypothetical protein n=1 Tax=Leptothoe sp. PORK10 BA2 TaxID=3110254 RepID=UPI002B200F69|nr:hypothetical protein [Leptothoe sp. PORK10 BA2]MEA5464663.1 hypothetical protein [Leptothoe sp. PORK10 BA2]